MRATVVVTGVGAVTPLGVGARALLRALGARASAAIATARAAARDFDPTDHLSVKEARRADRFTQLALAAVERGARRRGLGRTSCPTTADADRLRPRHRHRRHRHALEANDSRAVERGPKHVSPLAVPLMMGNAGAARRRMRHGLRGPALRRRSRPAPPGAHAIGAAMRTLQAGEADAVVAGGSEAALTPLARAAFSALDALSVDGISRPFDARRDGFVMGEGAGVLVLEDGERGARARRPRPRVAARLRRDARTPTTSPRPDPNGEGAGARDRARRSRDAGVAPRGHRLRQRPRHLDAAQRPRRDARDQARARRARRARSRSPRRSRRSATCSAPPARSRRSRRSSRCARA